LTPALAALALRAIAAGAPPVRRAAALSCRVAGQRHRCPESGLAYVAVEISRGGQLPHPEYVPDLSDPSWLGWTLAEVERRGWRWMVATGSDGRYRVVVWHPSGQPAEGGWDAPDRPSALVAMLEATLPPATPSKPTTSQG
jgi:hypothetical protein